MRKGNSNIRLALQIILCAQIALAPLGNAADLPTDSLGLLSPATLVGAPASSYSMIDTSGYERFRKVYQDRRALVYAMTREGELVSLHRKEENIPGHQPELWVYADYDGSARTVYLLENLPDSMSSELSEALEASYYAFDAKVFDERSHTHPNGWGTMLIVGLGNNDRISSNLSNQCMIFDVTDAEQAPALLSVINHQSIGECMARPSAFTLPGEGDSGPRWYLALGSGEGVEQAYIHFYDLQELKLVNEIKIDRRRNSSKPSGDVQVGGISAADIDQDGITDLLYFGTANEGRRKTGGRLYSLTFAKHLTPSEPFGEYEDLPSSAQYREPRLALMFDTHRAIYHSPLLKRDPEGSVWLFFSTESAVYAVKEDFSRQVLSEHELGRRKVKKRGWYRVLPKETRFTSGVSDLGEVIALNAFSPSCPKCSGKGVNRANLYYAFSGEEVEILLAENESKRLHSGYWLTGIEGLPKSRVDPTMFTPEFLTLLSKDKRESLSEVLHGVEISEGVRRLSWWQQ